MDEPGPLIGSGRAADIFDRGDGTVERRYRNDYDTAAEARVMQWVAEQGVPVPAVHDAEGRSIVMDRVEGPTMLDDLTAHPWRVVHHARTLAGLQRQVNALVAPRWFPHRDGVAPGRSVVHLDLHPLNVLLGPTGPVVIDWTNASTGTPGFDAAMTYAVMASFEVSGPRDQLAQRFMVGVFARARGRRELRAALPDAVAYRLLDRNVTPGERQALERMVRNRSRRSA